MALYTDFLVAFVAFLLSILFLLRQKRPKNYPPGPLGVPVFGNAFQMGAMSVHKETKKMAEKYGDILGLTAGAYRLVVLVDPEDIREAFGKMEFTGKYGFNGFTDQNHGVNNAGLIFGEGKVWVDTRRFSLKTLRDFGLGRRSMETVIMTEVEALTQKLKNTKGSPISTAHLFNGPVFTVIWSLVAAERFGLDDPELEKLIRLLHDFMQGAFQGIRPFFFIFPWLVELKNKFPGLFPKAASVQFRAELWSFFRKTIEEHRRTIELGNPRDFIDCYLEEAQKNEKNNDANSAFSNNDDDNGLLITLLDLFIAGADTTSTTLVWAFFILAQHQDTQEKLYKEIRTIADSRPVTLADRASMPYTEAVIAELSRFASIAAVGAPHSTLEDVNFKGFSLPKHTIVMSNLYAVHYSKKLWQDPENFRPERFLSQDEKTFVRNKNLMAFGVGKRSCVGELLARDELFLFLTNLFLNFKVKMPEDEPRHSLEGRMSGVMTPEPHRVIVLDRNS